MRHFTTDELESYTLKHAAPELVIEIEEHLFVCEPCRAELTYLEEQIDLMRQLLAQFAEEEFERELASSSESRTRSRTAATN